MNVTPQERDLLIRTVIGEADDEPDEGKAGVAYSVINRKNTGGYGDTIPQILFKPKQYEPWNTRSKQLMSYAEEHPSYIKAAKVVDGVLSGEIADPTNGATHFANVDLVRKRGNTSAMKWINGMDNVSQIGGHTFGNADAGRNKMADLKTEFQNLRKDFEPDANATDFKSEFQGIRKDFESGQASPVVVPVASEATAKEPPAPTGEWWQGANEDKSWAGVAKRFGIGAVRGAKDIIDTGAHGLQNAATFVGDKVLSTEMAKGLRASVEESQALDKSGRDAFNKEYPTSDSLLPDMAGAGRFVGELAATAPLMPAKAFQAIDAGFKAAPSITAAGAKMAAPLINRLSASVAKGGVGGGIYGAATASKNDQSLSENVGEGAITGAIAGPLMTATGDVAKKIGGKVLGEISPKTADLAKRAEQLGIDLPASNVSPSGVVKKFDQMSGMLPLSGAQAVKDKLMSQFTRAVSRTFGENTEEITPQLVESARRKIGAEIGSVGNNATIRADQQLGNDLRKVVSDAHATVSEGELRPIFTQVQNIIDKIGPSGHIDGKAYEALTHYKAPLSKAQSNSNPNIRNAANEIRGALDDALERSIPTSERDRLIAARKQYKAVMTIKNLAESNPDGNISPLKLMQKVISSPGGKLRSGELGELADIGRKFFPVPADSGTPLGELVLSKLAPFVQSPLAAAAGTAAAIKSGIGLVDAGLGVGGLVVNRLARNVVNSKTAKDAIIRSGTGETYGASDKAVNVIAPYSAQIGESRDAKSNKRIEVRPAAQIKWYGEIGK